MDAHTTMMIAFMQLVEALEAPGSGPTTRLVIRHPDGTEAAPAMTAQTAELLAGLFRRAAAWSQPHDSDDPALAAVGMPFTPDTETPN